MGVRALIEFIAAEPGMADRLLVKHIADQRGRCQACGNGPGGHLRWPCSLYHAAMAARRGVDPARPE